MYKHLNHNFIFGNYPKIDAVAKTLTSLVLVNTDAAILLDDAINHPCNLTRGAARSGLFARYPELRKEWARNFLSGPNANFTHERVLAIEELARVPVYPSKLRKKVKTI